MKRACSGTGYIKSPCRKERDLSQPLPECNRYNVLRPGTFTSHPTASQPHGSTILPTIRASKPFQIRSTSTQIERSNFLDDTIASVQPPMWCINELLVQLEKGTSRQDHQKAQVHVRFPRHSGAASELRFSENLREYYDSRNGKSQKLLPLRVKISLIHRDMNLALASLLRVPCYETYPSSCSSHSPECWNSWRLACFLDADCGECDELCL